MKKTGLAVIVLCFFTASATAEKTPDDLAMSAFVKSYLTAVRNSTGSRIFRRLYLYSKSKGRVVEVLQNGNLACAYYVSSILLHFGLLGDFYVNTDETADAMKATGWQIVPKPVPGSVIVWEKRYFKKSKQWHGHVGFFIGPGRAISTSSQLGIPVVHNLHPKGRRIVEILWHPFLPAPDIKALKEDGNERPAALR